MADCDATNNVCDDLWQNFRTHKHIYHRLSTARGGPRIHRDLYEVASPRPVAKTRMSGLGLHRGKWSLRLQIPRGLFCPFATLDRRSCPVSTSSSAPTRRQGGRSVRSLHRWLERCITPGSQGDQSGQDTNFVDHLITISNIVAFQMAGGQVLLKDTEQSKTCNPERPCKQDEIQAMLKYPGMQAPKFGVREGVEPIAPCEYCSSH